MQQPEEAGWGGRLLFAGEGCSVNAHQCVHGAYETGETQALMCLQALQKSGGEPAAAAEQVESSAGQAAAEVTKEPKLGLLGSGAWMSSFQQPAHEPATGWARSPAVSPPQPQQPQPRGTAAAAAGWSQAGAPLAQKRSRAYLSAATGL